MFMCMVTENCSTGGYCIFCLGHVSAAAHGRYPSHEGMSLWWCMCDKHIQRAMQGMLNVAADKWEWDDGAIVIQIMQP